ncbi:MAG: hypothetical protein AAF500_00310 [Myxococcota bacterium]
MNSGSLIGIMVGAQLAGTAVVFFVLKLANERRETIVTGVYRGTALSKKHRWMIFTNDWIAYKFMPVAILVGGATAFVQLGNDLVSPGPQLISFMTSSLFAFGALGIAVLGVSDFIFILSTLRGVADEPSNQ